MSNPSLLLVLALSAVDLTRAPAPLPAAELVLKLPGGRRAVARVDSLASFGPESWVFGGHLLGERDSSFLVSQHGGVVRGVLRSGLGEFQITAAPTMGATPSFVARPFSARSQEDRAPLVPAAPELAEQGGASEAVSSGVGPIDLLVVYTPRARAAAGSARDMEALVQLGVAETNLALERSGVAARVRLVELRELSYLESGRVESDLEILRSPADGALDEVQELRDAFGADLVQLVVAEDDGCGIAYLLPRAASPLEGWAFSVVEWSCIESGLALAHELGHSLGCDHAPDDPTSGGAFDFSFGYRDPMNRFRTVMAYGPAPRVARFSSARARIGGLPTGGAGQDNARTIDRMSRGVARFRPALEPPRLMLATGSKISGAAADLAILPSGREEEYWVVAGTSPGARDLFDSGLLQTGARIQMSGLPSDGRPVFVRFFYRPGGVWLHEDYRFVGSP